MEGREVGREGRKGEHVKYLLIVRIPFYTVFVFESRVT